VSGLVVASVALALCGAVSGVGEHALSVASVSLASESTPDGHRRGSYRAEFEFTEPDLGALRDDEAQVEVRVLDRDGHGGRHLLGDNLEDCRISADRSMHCPGGVVFQPVAGHPSRWRVAIAFRARSSADTFRGPVTVRFSYSVSGGPETVHVGTIASCKPAHGSATLTCRAKRRGEAASAHGA
jgi:hypothetical protein